MPIMFLGLGLIPDCLWNVRGWRGAEGFCRTLYLINFRCQ